MHLAQEIQTGALPLACLGVFENMLAKTSSVEDWIGQLRTLRSRFAGAFPRN